VLELSKPINNIYTSTFQQCIPFTFITSPTLQYTVKHLLPEPSSFSLLALHSIYVE